jgi:catechol 2,3-dioxygenase-like lactoylglutathione lyase family enzyme
MRFQLALNVDNLEVAIDYYSRLFGVDVNKRKPGYANFVVENPALKLVLFEAPGAERLNHVGVEVFEDTDVDELGARMREEGLLTEQQQGEVCCFASQNKAVSHDPQGLMWEWYRVLEDSPTFFAEPKEVVAPAEETTSRTCC